MEIRLENCTIRSFKINDAPSLAHHANNKNIWLQLRDVFPHTYSEKDANFFIELCLKQNPQRNFAITINDEAVGAIGFTLQQDIERFSAEIGYWLSEKYWGKGITTNVLREMIKYGFETYKLNRIFALPLAKNEGSLRVLEKAGFEREGLLKQSAFKNNRFEDQFIYACLRG
jgi:RimJ/RimL family protein N-acetyltransferase